MRQEPLSRDVPLTIFGSIVTLLVVVSAPATYHVIAQFHSAGDWIGTVFAVAMLISLEVGAVGCKFSTALVPQWRHGLNILTIALLILTTIANYAVGHDYIMLASSPGPTLESWRDAGYAPLMALIFAGIVPLLLFVFMSLFVARYKALLQQPTQRDIYTEIREEIQEARREFRAALPGMTTDDESAPIVSVRTTTAYECPSCSAPLSQSKYGAARRWGHCEYCRDDTGQLSG
jgi:hypothetical protein